MPAGMAQQDRTMGGQPDGRAPHQRSVRRDAQPVAVRAIGMPPHRVHHRERLADPGGALGARAERDAVRGMLGNVRAGAETDDCPAAGDRVDDRDHLRGDLRGAVAGRQHGHPEADARRDGRDRGQRRQGVEGRIGLDPAR
jgi:hypothetical protein